MRWFFFFLALYGYSSSSGQGIVRLDNIEFSELLKDEEVQLIDVRTPEEVSKGVIENAEMIDYFDPEFKTKLSQLETDQPIAVYCAVGGRSYKACQILKDLGFSEIYDLKDGYNGWVNSNYPTVKL